MKKIKNFFFFDNSLEQVFNFIKDITKTDSLFSDIRSSTEITEGTNTYEPGNKLNYIVNNKKVEFEVLDYEDEEKLKSIKWLVKADLMEYEYEYIFYKCTVGGEVILEWNLNFINNTPFDTDEAIRDMNNCMTRIKNHLKSDLTNYFVSESIVIKTDRISVLNSILSLDKIKSNALFGKIRYSGDPNKVNSKIYMTYPMIGLCLKFYVEKAEFIEQSHEWTYKLKLKSTKSNVSPIKEIIFSIIKIKSNKTYVEIKHTFNKIVDKELLNSIKETEAEFLINLKSQLIIDEK